MRPTTRLKKTLRGLIPPRLRPLVKAVLPLRMRKTAKVAALEAATPGRKRRPRQVIADSFPHLVITRMMIGVARPSAFNLHARVLVETLLPSLANQSFSDFHWVIITDKLIDAKSRAFLEQRLSSHPNFHLEMLDPFETFSNAVDVEGLCRKYLGTTKNVVTTRIDDDDALRFDFLERVQRQVVERNEKFVAVSFRKGVRVATDAHRYCFYESKRGASAGMSVFSANAARMHVHSTGHGSMHGAMKRHGGVSFHIQDRKPYYLSGEHGTSDSRERRDESKSDERLERYVPSSKDPEKYRGLLKSFGLPGDFDDRINAIRKHHVDHAPPIFRISVDGTRPMSRLGLKGHYMSRARALWEQLPQAAPDERRRLEFEIQLLRQAYYLV